MGNRSYYWASYRWISHTASRKISKVISYQFNIWEVHVFLTLFVCIVLLFGYPHKLHLASGASILLYQPFFYPHIVKVLGPVNASHVAAILSMVLLFTYPPMTHLSKPWLLVVVNIPSVLKNNLVVTIVTCSFILQNNSVPQEQRTTANGLATTLMSFFKAFAPAGAGIVFSWAQKRQHAFLFPGDQMVFFLLDIVIFVELIWTFKPLLAIPEQIS